MPLKTDNSGQQPYIQLGDAERAAITAAFLELGPGVVGNDVAGLVQHIERALAPRYGRYRELGFTISQAAQAERESSIIAAKLTALADAARELLAVMPNARGSDTPVRERWRTRIDLFTMAAAPMLNGGDTERPRIRTSDLRASVELIGRLNANIVRARRGRPYDHGLGGGLVRAVCYYVSTQPEMRLSFGWREEDRSAGTQAGSRGGRQARRGDNLVSTTQTNELIVQAARIFNIQIDHSALRTHLRNYQRELEAFGSTQPEEADLDGPWFDAKPTR